MRIALLALILASPVWGGPYELAGMRLMQDLSVFEQLPKRIKDYTTVTYGPDKKIVRIYFKQENIAATKNNMINSLKRLCSYGMTTQCYKSLEEIEKTPRKFNRFFQMYRNPETLSNLRVRIIREGNRYQVDADLMTNDYEIALRDQTLRDQKRQSDQQAQGLLNALIGLGIMTGDISLGSVPIIEGAGFNRTPPARLVRQSNDGVNRSCTYCCRDGYNFTVTYRANQMCPATQ